MVGGFDIVQDPKDVAFYAGILFTSFNCLKTVTVTYWGILSDRIGRRPVILVGLLGDLLTFVLFGISKSFTWAVVIRSLNGFFTGGTVVIRPIIAEISDDTNRARMMSMFPLLAHVGFMLGGAIGGLTADPVKNYPSLFGNSVLFRKYPYLLPCLVNSMICLFGLVVGFFYLEETLVVKQAIPTPNSDSMSETTPLVTETHGEEGRVQTNAKPEPLSKWDILTPTVIRVLATNACLCLAIVMHNQIYSIFAATAIADGGLGMDPRTIGYTLMLCSGFIVYLQLVVYYKEERKYGTLACYRYGLLWLAAVGIAMPLLSNLAQYSGNSTNANNLPSPGTCLFWGLLTLCLYVRMYGDTLAFSSIYIIVANVAPRKNCLGLINGLQQQINSITTMVGPLIWGYAWSWSIKHSFSYPFNSHFAWILSSVTCLIGWYIALKVPDSVNMFASGSDEQGVTDMADDDSC
ncbi:hypothetical protein EV175_003434 [Coemansia sp. RSA 1933]|nr:hypothetical protein EV175_003434 [Coemansia sp. RSA 1933]